MVRKTAVVTGVAGFIGSHLAERLLEEGYHVEGIDNFDPHYSEGLKRKNVEEIRGTGHEDKFKLVNGSINSTEDLQDLSKRPDKVFHLAAKPGTRSSIGRLPEYRRTNVQGTSNVLEYFEPVKKLVYMSSSSIYGEKNLSELPVKEEEDTRNPQNPYAKTKLEAERMVKEKTSEGFETVALRPFTVFGPRQRPDEMFTSFISDIVDGNSINVYGDGSQSRDFTPVDDVVSGALKASERGSGVYNLGRGRRSTVREIIEIMDERLPHDIKVDYGERRDGDVSHTHADIERAKTELGFEPSDEIEDTVVKTIKWVKDMKERNLL